MVRKTLDFHQIIYQESQRDALYPFASEHFNTTLTPFFENSVIAELIPTMTADLLSVCSWRLKEKRHDAWRLVDKTLNEEKILSARFDVAILTPRSPSHQMLYMAGQWHGDAWHRAIAALRDFIKVPKEVTHCVYENHFIATKEVYHEYVSDCLLPCIDFMSGNPVFFADAGYIQRKRGEERDAIRFVLKEKLGRDDYPIAPFVLERLFSIWMEGKKLNVIAL